MDLPKKTAKSYVTKLLKIIVIYFKKHNEKENQVKLFHLFFF